MVIGVAGLGKMGSAIAARLLDRGHAVVVWNRTEARAAPLLEMGAVLADTPAKLARRCDVIISMLFDGDAVNQVYHAAGGVLTADLTGKLVIEMTTLRPGAQIVLAAGVRDRGGAFIECPVGGTTGPARSGQLLGLVGGAPGDVEQARPVLEDLCRRIEHIGPVGAGATMKLAINLPLLVFWQALGESAALVSQLGLDPAWLITLFADTSGGPNVLKGRGPAIAAALAGEDPGEVTFDIDSIRKDLRTMKDTAAARGFTLPVASRALEVFDAASAEGWGARDCAWLPTYWKTKSK
jgi:3-hydroxyisobutyrate dehydrogenase